MVTFPHLPAASGSGFGGSIGCAGYIIFMTLIVSILGVFIAVGYYGLRDAL